MPVSSAPRPNAANVQKIARQPATPKTNAPINGASIGAMLTQAIITDITLSPTSSAAIA